MIGKVKKFGDLVMIRLNVTAKKLEGKEEKNVYFSIGFQLVCNFRFQTPSGIFTDFFFASLSEKVAEDPKVRPDFQKTFQKPENVKPKNVIVLNSKYWKFLLRSQVFNHILYFSTLQIYTSIFV